ncbi:24092_t:CDS:2, partial [Cetraspora pellucida]
YTRPSVRINTIPMNQLENVKDWLECDIQFYREASDVQLALLNKEFKQFTEKVAEAVRRTNVLLQPTTECLVHLTELPFLVVPTNRHRNRTSGTRSDCGSEALNFFEAVEEPFNSPAYDVSSNLFRNLIMFSPGYG